MDSSSSLLSALIEQKFHLGGTLSAVIALFLGIGVCVALIPLIPGIGGYVERKLAADIQQRIGPNRAGFLPFGFLQWVADGVKLFQKEDLMPAEADRFLFKAAPYVCVVGAFSCFAALPFSEFAYLADLNIGVYYIISVSSLVAVGVVLAGWASKSKWTILGGIRSAGQMISYEIPIALSVATVAMYFGTLDMAEMTAAQKTGWKIWFWNSNIFVTLSFPVFWVSCLAECNRTPFDLPEAESELVAGYFTEYSGMRFVFFAMTEYAEMFVMCAIAVVLYFGGFYLPLENLIPHFQNLPAFVISLIHFVTFLVKVWLLIILMIWIRWTLPRYRIDQMMELCWKALIPLAFVNFIGTAVWMVWVG